MLQIECAQHVDRIHLLAYHWGAEGNQMREDLWEKACTLVQSFFHVAQQRGKDGRARQNRSDKNPWIPALCNYTAG